MMTGWRSGATALPFGLRPEDLKRDHLSRPRNPLIAEVFYRRGLVERWGRGTQRLVDLCVTPGHPEPELLEQAAQCACASFRAVILHRRIQAVNRLGLAGKRQSAHIAFVHLFKL
jgi:predicted HTH transcriptional regulator